MWVGIIHAWSCRLLWIGHVGSKQLERFVSGHVLLHLLQLFQCLVLSLFCIALRLHQLFLSFLQLFNCSLLGYLQFLNDFLLLLLHCILSLHHQLKCWVKFLIVCHVQLMNIVDSLLHFGELFLHLFLTFFNVFWATECAEFLIWIPHKMQIFPLPNKPVEVRDFE